MQPSETFSPAKLREQMTIRGLSMADMAQRAGLHVSTISNAMARGRCELATLKAIARVLDDVQPIVGIVAIRKRVMPTNVDMTLTPEDRIRDYHEKRARRTG
jgi:lambda repressor-like predicted transcriptional regulator